MWKHNIIKKTGDISNVFATILSTVVVIGLLIDRGINWWISNRQQKITDKQKLFDSHFCL